MIDAIIRFSIRNRFLILIFAALLVGVGLWAARRLPIDAVPDITSRQVVVNASAPALGPEDVERRITFPLEVALGGADVVLNALLLTRWRRAAGRTPP